jgi:hypothetical protein
MDPSTLTYGVATIVFSIALFIIFKQLTNTVHELGGSREEIKIGTGFFIAFAANVALVVEQYTIKMKRNSLT